MGSWALLVAIWFIFGDRIIACQLYDPDRFLRHSSQVWWINKFKIMPARAHASSFLHYQSLFRAFFLLSFKLEQADGGFFFGVIWWYHFAVSLWQKGFKWKKKKKNMVGLTSGNSLHWSVFFPWNERSVVRREYCVTEICRDVRSRISGRQSSTHATHSPVDRKLEWCGFKRRAKRTFKTAGKSRAWWSYLAFILYTV